MRRGEVWLADLPDGEEKLPVVLLSRDEAYQLSDLVTVAPVTLPIRGISTEVCLGPEDGLGEDCAVVLDTITTIPKECLAERVAELSSEKIAAVDRALQFALGLSEPRFSPLIH